MAVESAGPTRTSFELKSAQLSVVAVVLKRTDSGELAAQLERQRQDDQAFFDDDLVLIDLAAVAQDDQPIDFAALAALLREHRTWPVAVRGGSPAQMQAALQCGLVAAPPEVVRRPTPAPAVQEVVHEVEVVREVPADAPPTLVIDKPVRSGQRVYSRGDLVVLAIVNFGAEVIADGSIHVYAPLRGRAMAGARGDVHARIYTTCLEPQLVSIAGMYRTTENELPEDVRGKAAQVRLDGEKLIFEPL
ncbi:septum site-determining protein MinC [Comamonas badia]|uniref:septum site-determining protein MinC n=1 Tax=Comamonas badia TaxID=265291 RepID=UPI0003F9CDEE|nr:septum site-determining protein MinC [Comamonas badia]